MEGVLVMKNVSVKLFSFFNGGCIGDQERVCKTLRFPQWSVYRWSRTCLLKLSASLMDGIFVIKNVSVTLFNFSNGGSIGDQERVCQTHQFLQWRVYWWSRTCLSKSSASSMEGVLVIKTCLPKSSASLTDGIFVIKNVSVNLFSSLNGEYIGDQERVCQTLQFLQWRVYWWSRTCLSNSSTSLMEGLLMTKNVSVKLFNFSNGGCIGDQERVCLTLQFLQWREYLWSRTCLSNSSASLMEGVLVIKNVSVKLFSSLNGECIGVPERVCQTLQLLQRRVYRWSRTCLSKSSASIMDGIFVIKNVCGKLFSVINGGYIHDQERVCQTLQFL